MDEEIADCSTIDPDDLQTGLEPGTLNDIFDEDDYFEFDEDDYDYYEDYDY